MKAPHKIDPSRLTIIEAIASRIHAENAALQEEFMKLRDEKLSLNAQIRRMTDQVMRPNDVITDPSTGKTVRSLEARIAEIDQQLAELGARRDQNREKWNAASRLKDRCADFLNDPSRLSPSGSTGSGNKNDGRWSDRPTSIQRPRVPEMPNSISSTGASGGEVGISAARGGAERSTGAAQAILHDDDALTRQQLDEDLFEGRNAEEEGR